MYQSTKILELGSCAFRQWKSAPGEYPDGYTLTKRNSKCYALHGYLLRGKFWFNADKLDHRNWIFDFGSLRPLKEIFQKQFDHCLICDQGDPLLPLFQELHNKGGCDLRIMDGVGIEKTAEWCYHAAQQFIDQETNGRCWVSKVEVWEHELNSAIYIPSKGDPFKYFPIHE